MYANGKKIIISRRRRHLANRQRFRNIFFNSDASRVIRLVYLAMMITARVIIVIGPRFEYWGLILLLSFFLAT